MSDPPRAPGAAPGAGPLAGGLEHLSQLELLPGPTREVLAEAVAKLRSTTVYVAVVGDFKRGKSSLINALLGAPLLPVGVIPVTAQPTIVRYGAEAKATVHLEAGNRPIGLEQIADYITEKANPNNRLKVRELWVEYPSPLLQAGLVVVDTPGTGSLHQHNTAAAQAFLPRIDVAIAVLTGESPLSLSEAEWLTEVAGRAARIAVCLNKVDSLAAGERAEALEYVRAGLRSILGDLPLRLFETSARRELESGGDPGVAELRGWLEGEVAAARAGLILEGAVTVGGQAVELARGLVALERAALAAPAEKAEQRAARLSQASRKLERVGREGRALIGAESKELVRGTVEPELEGMRERLAARLRQAENEAAWTLELESTAAATAGRLQELVRQPLAAALTEQAGRLQEVLDQFVDEVASLYEVSLGRPPRLEDPSRLPQVRVTTTDEAGALAMGVRAMRGAVPGAAGRRWRQRAREREALEAADRLSGRLRFAAVAAVEEAVREWLIWSDGQWRGLHQALSGALARGSAAAAEQPGAATALEERLLGAERLLDEVAGLLAAGG